MSGALCVVKLVNCGQSICSQYGGEAHTVGFEVVEDRAQRRNQATTTAQNDDGESPQHWYAYRGGTSTRCTVVDYCFAIGSCVRASEDLGFASTQISRSDFSGDYHVCDNRNCRHGADSLGSSIAI